MPVAVDTQASVNSSFLPVFAASSTGPSVASPLGSMSQLQGWALEPSLSLSPTIAHEPVIRLSGRLTPDIALRESLSITVARDELGQVVAYESRVNVYGVGMTTVDALDDLVSMLVDLAQELLDSEAILSSGLHQRLALLRSILTLD